MSGSGTDDVLNGRIDRDVNRILDHFKSNFYFVLTESLVGELQRGKKDEVASFQDMQKRRRSSTIFTSKSHSAQRRVSLSPSSGSIGLLAKARISAPPTLASRVIAAREPLDKKKKKHMEFIVVSVLDKRVRFVRRSLKEFGALDESVGVRVLGKKSFASKTLSESTRRSTSPAFFSGKCKDLSKFLMEIETKLATEKDNALMQFLGFVDPSDSLTQPFVDESVSMLRRELEIVSAAYSDNPALILFRLVKNSILGTYLPELEQRVFDSASKKEALLHNFYKKVDSLKDVCTEFCDAIAKSFPETRAKCAEYLRTENKEYAETFQRVESELRSKATASLRVVLSNISGTVPNMLTLIGPCVVDCLADVYALVGEFETTVSECVKEWNPEVATSFFERIINVAGIAYTNLGTCIEDIAEDISGIRQGQATSRALRNLPPLEEGLPRFLQCTVSCMHAKVWKEPLLALFDVLKSLREYTCADKAEIERILETGEARFKNVVQTQGNLLLMNAFEAMWTFMEEMPRFSCLAWTLSEFAFEIYEKAFSGSWNGLFRSFTSLLHSSITSRPKGNMDDTIHNAIAFALREVLPAMQSTIRSIVTNHISNLFLALFTVPVQEFTRRELYETLSSKEFKFEEPLDTLIQPQPIIRNIVCTELERVIKECVVKYIPTAIKRLQRLRSPASNFIASPRALSLSSPGVVRLPRLTMASVRLSPRLPEPDAVSRILGLSKIDKKDN